jgi:tetratricopeptide (TPR) repeat protein
MEASATPQLALKSAHVLDTLMPLVSHLTHMPSHIYIRTGYYQQGIKNNETAVAGYKDYVKRYSPVINGAGLYQIHNMHLGVNCAQMGGNYKTAIRGADSLVAAIPTDYLSLPGSDGNYAQYVYMQPVFTNIRFGKWDDVLKVKLMGGKYPYAKLLLHFGRGLAWCSKGKVGNAQLELRLLKDQLKNPTLKVPIDNFSTAYEAACVAELILQGMIAKTQKNDALAITTLQKAVIAEDNLIYNEPRDWPIPARQYLAWVLLKDGKYNDAINVLNKDLAINPNNGWALTGLQTAYQNTGDAAALATVKARLKAAWKIKDIAIDAPVLDR